MCKKREGETEQALKQRGVEKEMVRNQRGKHVCTCFPTSVEQMFRVSILTVPFSPLFTRYFALFIMLEGTKSDHLSLN